MTPPCCRGPHHRGLDPFAVMPGIEGPRGLPADRRALLRRGLPPGDVRKILGGNALRLLRAEIGVPGRG